MLYSSCCYQNLTVLPDYIQMKESLWVNISEDAQDLIHRMLDANPSTRITIEEALEHRWIKVLSLLITVLLYLRLQCV